MNLNTIKTKIEKAGYLVILKKVGKEKLEFLTAGVPDKNTKMNMDAVFQVLLAENKILLIHPIRQISYKHYFTDERGLMNYITENFPLKK